MDVEAEVYYEGEKILGEVSFTLEGEINSMRFLCERKFPCDWDVLKQWFAGEEVSPIDYDKLSGISLPSLTGALEEKYQILRTMEQEK